MCAWPEFMCTICIGEPTEARKGYWIPVKVELQVEGHYVSARNRTPILCKSNKCSILADELPLQSPTLYGSLLI